MKKPIKIGVLINKGGAGKTTTTVCLADALLNLYPNSKALIIDADDQSNIKTIFRLKIKDSEGGLSAVLREGLDPSKLFHEVRPNLSVMISGGRALADFATEFRTVPESEYLMRKRFENLEGFDFILVDSPPSLSLITTNIATFVDYVLIPATPDLLSLVGVKNLINLLQSYEDEEKKKARPNPIGSVLGVVPTQVDQRRNIDLDIIEDLERLEQSDLLNGGVIFDPIRVDSKVRTAQVKRKLLSEAFPKSNASEDYGMLAREIIEQIEKIKRRDPIAHFNRETRRFSEVDV
ncbi:MAG: ParA family protein [Bdellovibrionales bacterium]|nr:ParA family protein [Bdellovibrionales bacterium]